MGGYDVIGDVHGCADKLEGLLKKLGYEKRDGVYRHPGRQAIFVGDLIDRGGQQIETLVLVRAMIESGSAQTVMGNHEFNAISFATPNPEIPGEFMRSHNDKNRKQHKEFMDQVQLFAGDYAQWIEWFKTMPIHLDLGGFRVVHACWNDKQIEKVDQWIASGTPMPVEFVIRANQKGTAEHEAIEVLLKGPELSLTKYKQPNFKDKDDHVRSQARIRWWNANGTTLQELAEIPPGAKTSGGSPYPPLPSIDCQGEADYDYKDPKPAFYGHYWRRCEPEEGQDWTSNTVCVDFSAVKGGPLVAYRWDGEAKISGENYVEFPETSTSPPS